MSLENAFINIWNKKVPLILARKKWGWRAVFLQFFKLSQMAHFGVSIYEWYILYHYYPTTSQIVKLKGKERKKGITISEVSKRT